MRPIQTYIYVIVRIGIMGVLWWFHCIDVSDGELCQEELSGIRGGGGVVSVKCGRTRGREGSGWKFIHTECYNSDGIRI